MKTTVDLPDLLLEEAKEVAHREGSTFRSLVEEGLRLALERRKRSAGFRLRDASVGGEGLNPEWRGRCWDEVLALVYDGRGA